MDYQQITFVMLNRFFLLSKTPPPQLTVLNIHDQAGWNTNQNQMKNICPFLHCISRFEGISYIQPLVLSFPIVLH